MLLCIHSFLSVNIMSIFNPRGIRMHSILHVTMATTAFILQPFIQSNLSSIDARTYNIYYNHYYIAYILYNYIYIYKYYVQSGNFSIVFLHIGDHTHLQNEKILQNMCLNRVLITQTSHYVFCQRVHTML
jgi:hypothetical protein